MIFSINFLVLISAGIANSEYLGKYYVKVAIPCYISTRDTTKGDDILGLRRNIWRDY